MLIKHRVTTQDTLRSLAAEYMGTSSRWPEIAAVNGISGNDDLAKVLEGIPPFHALGGEILIPVALDARNDDDPYLIDLVIENGDLAWDQEAGDLKVHGGRANFAAALIRSFQTEAGELSEHPAYGLDVERFAGEASGDIHRAMIQLEADLLIRSDPRTRDVQGLEVKFNGPQKRLTIAARVFDLLGKITRLSATTEA